MSTSGGVAVGPTPKQRALLSIVRVIAVVVYVASSVLFLQLYFNAAHMAVEAEQVTKHVTKLAVEAGVSPVKIYLECGLGGGSTLTDCAVDLVSETANLATGMVGIAAGAIPAILYARARWELASAGAAIASGFIGMIAVWKSDDGAGQLIAVVGLLVVSLLLTTITPAFIRLREHAVRKDEGASLSLRPEREWRMWLLGRFETRVKQKHFLAVLPNWVVVLGIPIIAAIVFTVLFFVHS